MHYDTQLTTPSVSLRSCFPPLGVPISWPGLFVIGNLRLETVNKILSRSSSFALQKAVSVFKGAMHVPCVSTVFSACISGCSLCWLLSFGHNVRGFVSASTIAVCHSLSDAGCARLQNTQAQVVSSVMSCFVIFYTLT